MLLSSFLHTSLEFTLRSRIELLEGLQSNSDPVVVVVPCVFVDCVVAHQNRQGPLMNRYDCDARVMPVTTIYFRVFLLKLMQRARSQSSIKNDVRYCTVL